MSKKTSSGISRRQLLVAGAASLPLALLTSCGGGGGSGGSAGAGGTAAPAPTTSTPPAPSTSVSGNGPFIVVDQFGYLPDRAKIAVVRDPQTGFDAADAIVPGASYELVDAASGAVAYSGGLTAWKSGATDASSGDKAWHFDFSSVTAAGSYFVRDKANGIKSPTFKIAADVYRPILTAAVRCFFYQRSGCEKPAQFAGAGWADGASHLGPLQDKNCRLYSAPNDASTERDLSGGWYDAGDYNKYTAWHATYLLNLLHAYHENPGIWSDDYNLPESGNGRPDIIDEIKWGMDWLIKMQNADGSMLSIVGCASASPPSAATGQSLYGSANTSATQISAAAFAFGAKVLGGVGGLAAYAAALATRAENAWTWAQANPQVIFRNNDAAAGTAGLGAGQQETDDYGRSMNALMAAIYLYDQTGKAVYNSYVSAHYAESHLVGGYVSQYEYLTESALLHYASLAAATPSVATAIRNAFVNGMEASNMWGAVSADADPYMAPIDTYIWGSNAIKSYMGLLFMSNTVYGLGTHAAANIADTACGYLHYLHGVNPLGKVYLSNMSGYGATNSVDQFFHSWFAHGSAKWGSVSGSAYGPAPGYLVGGPNASYNWENGCPSLNAGCGSAVPSPPAGQPPQKTYKDFNDSWPLDSWQVTENSNGYQSAYIRLLAHFVR